MRFCVQCGTQLPDGAVFCTSCGARVAQADQPVDEPTQSISLDGGEQPTTSGGGYAQGQGAALPGAGAKPRPSSFDPDRDDASDFTQQAPVRPSESQGVGGSHAAQWQGQAQGDHTQQAPAGADQQWQGQGDAQQDAGGAFSQWQGQSYGDQTQQHQAYSGQTDQASSASAQQWHGQQQFGGQQGGYPAQHMGQQPGQQFAGQPGGQSQQQYGGQQWGGQPNPSGQNAQPWGSPAGGGAGLNIDWMALLPGLLRIVAAVALSMTALGNWWIFGDGDPATSAHVLPLIGCIGVALAAMVQLALLPQFLGNSVPPVARLGVRAVLCLPALIAIVIAIVTTLDNPFGRGDGKAALASVALLSMAVGFALVGIEEADGIIPVNVLRWAPAVCAGLGAVLTLVSIVQAMSSDSLTGKEKWLLVVFSLLAVLAIAGLVIWVGLKRPASGSALVVGLAGGVAISALTRAWLQSDERLGAAFFYRGGHGAPLIALAWALAPAFSASELARPLTDDAARARRATEWVVPSFAVAAVAAFVTALVYIGGRDGSTQGGETWFMILLFITALAYGACAYLLRTNPMGRLIAVCTVATLSLVMLITMASSANAGSTGEMFTEGAYLWMPIIAVCALTVLPSVRRVSGPLLPQGAGQTRPNAGNFNTQNHQAQGGQQYGAPGQFGGQQAQQGQFPQQGTPGTYDQNDR